MRLEIRVLPEEKLPDVFRWNGGHRQGWDFDEWLRQMRRPDWTHYGVYRGEIFIGCISLELRDPVTVSYHLAFRSRTARLKELRSLLISIGKALFQHGMQRLEAPIPHTNRAARLLALSCGLSFMSRTEDLTILGMTAADYQSNPAKWDGMIYV